MLSPGRQARLFLGATCLSTVCFLIPGCGQRTLQDITKKAEGLKTKEEIQKVLGKPAKQDSIDILGRSAERWIYRAPDGSFTVIIANGQVIATSSSTGAEK